MTPFTDSLREWRKHRKMSQLDLALSADVSQRHVSWLETGRSAPSREMVVRLSDAMDVPLRERNSLLNAAGFTDVYSEFKLDEPEMTSVKNILTEMLKHHEPYPAFVLDRHWNIKLMNQAATALFELGGPAKHAWQAVNDDGNHNIALLTLHPKGLRQFISNWHEIVGPFVRRLKCEAIESGDPELMTRYKELARYMDNDPGINLSEPLLPMMPINYDIGGVRLSLCSVISTFGTAQDITTDELRVETFYPADKATANYFRK